MYYWKHWRGLDLTQVSRKPTWCARGTESTIDLVFATKRVKEKLVKCVVGEEKWVGSDHLPVTTEFSLEMDSLPERKRRSWKKADPEEVKKAARKWNPGTQTLETKEAIDGFIDKLYKAAERVAEKTIP